MGTWQNSVEAISAALGTIFVIIAAWIGLRQWNESLSSRLTQGGMALITQLQEGSTRETRDYLLQHRESISGILSGPHPLEGLDAYLKKNKKEGIPTSIHELRKSLATLEFIAILCLTNQLPRDLERSYLAPTIVRYWEAAEPIALAIRARRGSNIYLQHVEALVKLLQTGKLFERRSTTYKRKELQRIERESRSATMELFDSHDLGVAATVRVARRRRLPVRRAQHQHRTNGGL
jgi:hypothetical protein